MNDQTPRKGDLALVLRAPRYDALPHLNGAVVEVLDDPVWLYDVFMSNIMEPNCWHPTAYLIRIPPDSESQTLFADEPVERGVSV